MSKLLEQSQRARELANIKAAMHEVGCDLCGVDDMTDVADAIRKNLVHGPKAVVNAKLAAGSGIKITPIDRSGYKISANDEALLSGDISRDLPKGTSVHKVLFDIVNKQIPMAVKEAASAPAIVDVQLFRAEYDGVDYYDNKAFGRSGKGRKTGLRPDTWYVKIYLYAQCEPIYISLGEAMRGMEDDILNKCYRMITSICSDMIAEVMCNNNISYPAFRPSKPTKPIKPTYPCRPEQPVEDNGCDLCNPQEEPDNSFGGFGGDNYEQPMYWPSKPNHACKPGKPNHACKPGKPNHACKPGKPGKPCKPIHPAPTERPNRPQFEKPDFSFGGFGGDEGYEFETPDFSDNDCDICNPYEKPDYSFGGFGGDEGYNQDYHYVEIDEDESIDLD